MYYFKINFIIPRFLMTTTYKTENLRWSARHWADSVIVLGKAFDDFGLGPAPTTPRKKAPSVNGLLSAATSGNKYYCTER